MSKINPYTLLLTVLVVLNSFLLSNALPIVSSSVASASTTIIATADITLDQSILAIPTTTSIETDALPSEEEDNINNACPTTNFKIPVERFAQLLSTHWQFDHLDSIKTGAYKMISELFQDHITVSIEAKHPSTNEEISISSRQKAFGIISAWDMMDMEILHAQIFGAIQAHTEGSLHLAWDSLADKLGRPAFEAYIRNVALEYCEDEEEKGMLGSECIQTAASKLSFVLDKYIKENLVQVFDAFDSDVLPPLLANTSKDLTDVLAYFNRLFSLGDDQQLYLQVTPWMQQTGVLQSRLLDLLDSSTLNDDHLLHFFSDYACLSRV